MALLGDLVTALASGDVRVVDLTQPLSERTPVLFLPEPFANTPGLSRRPISRYDDAGPAWAWDVLEVGEHVGTHFDAPIHWITGRDGEDVASVPPGRLVGPAAVIDKSAEAAEDPDHLLTLDDIRAFESEHGALPEGGWLLLRTGWDARAADQDAFLNGGRTPGPDAECARWLAEEAPITGFGVETVGTDAGAAHSFDPPFPVHHFLLGAGKYGITQLANLAELPPTGAVIVVAPLKLVDGTGSPSRVLALGLRPADAGCGGRGGQHLTGARPLGQPCDVLLEALGHAPVGGQQEQRPAVVASEHAGEAGPVELHAVEDLAPFADPADEVVAELAHVAPDRAVGVHADAVGADVLGPDTPVREAAVVGDVERRQPRGERLRDDQRRVVGRHHHAVGEGDVLRHPACRSVRGDQRDDPGGDPLVGVEVAAAVDVDVAAAVHDDLVEVVDAHSAQVGVRHHRAVGLDAREASAGHQQAPVGQPVDRPPEALRPLGDDLGVALEVDGDDLLRAPVGEPQAPFVPARRLADHEPGHQWCGCKHSSTIPSSSVKTRSARKHSAILDAATTVFLRNGYRGTSMDEIAASARVSKQTVYKHFADKETLFSAIVTAAVEAAGDPVLEDVEALGDSDDLEADLRALARRQLGQVVQPRLLQLRRLVIGEANRFPDLGRAFYDRGAGRSTAALSAAFERLTARGRLRADDPELAAAHFSWLVMAPAVNRPMLLGDDAIPTAAELDRYAEGGVRAFLAAYGPD